MIGSSSAATTTMEFVEDFLLQCSDSGVGGLVVGRGRAAAVMLTKVIVIALEIEVTGQL